MAAIAAAVIVAAGVGVSAYGASQAGKGAKAKVKNAPTFTPQGQAIQSNMLRLLFERLGKPPQSFRDFSTTGPQATMDPSKIPFLERQTLGLGSGLPTVIPQHISPELVDIMKRLGITPSERTEIRPNTPLRPEPPRPAPPRPATPMVPPLAAPRRS